MEGFSVACLFRNLKYPASTSHYGVVAWSWMDSKVFWSVHLWLEWVLPFGGMKSTSSMSSHKSIEFPISGYLTGPYYVFWGLLAAY